MPVRCGPFTPGCLLPGTALDATRVRGPEETLHVGGLPHLNLDVTKLDLHAYDGEEEPDGSHPSRCLCYGDDAIE